MKHITNKTPEEIYECICHDDPEKAFTYVIFGRTGPTGKTWLRNRLCNNGYTAGEFTEMLLECGAIFIYDDQNHYMLDELTKQVIIILNGSLIKYRPIYVENPPIDILKGAATMNGKSS